MPLTGDLGSEDRLSPHLDFLSILTQPPHARKNLRFESIYIYIYILYSMFALGG